MWSSMNSNENYLSEDPTKDQRIFLSKTNRNDEKHLRRDSDGIEYILSYIDRHCIGQVMFANNPLSSLIITIGLFIENWQLAFYGLLGTFISTLTTHISCTKT
ncbi:unnamed protein product [Adineta steineri]|uniref:Uncharacterized protein n=1 Tax=Adineta steineri TaxID=433720 RepID=A0A813PIK9_9BILA|nr:unnamed protein product [Adineta steineri]CAF3514478.1 unnamed protein product [Adineta steineri]